MDHKDSLGFEFKKMNDRIRRHIHAELATAGFDEMTVMHGWILGYLHRNEDQKIYQKDIENQFAIAKSTVTNILQLMEKKGYLIRKEDEKDARLKQLLLTELGRQTHQDTLEVINRLHDEMEVGITIEERMVVLQVIEKLKNNLDRIGGK